MSTSNVYIPQEGALSDLASWIGGDLGACLVKLYVNNVAYTPTRTTADYTEASWAGYAPVVAPAWGTPFVNGMGQAETDSPALTFNYSVGSGTETAFGMYVTDTTGTRLLAVVPFLAPFVFSPANDSLTETIQLTAQSIL